MEIIGKTTDGKITVAGIARMYFETGLPLAFMFDRLNASGYMPSWIPLYEEMKGNGISHKRIIDILHEQIIETYGKEFRDVVINRLHEYEKYKKQTQ